MLPNLPRENLLELCRRMFVIRHFEENLVALHDNGVFGGHYHLYVGQEATGVPGLSCLPADDYLFTTHRNHGHLLARGVEPKRPRYKTPPPITQEIVIYTTDDVQVPRVYLTWRGPPGFTPDILIRM